MWEKLYQSFHKSLRGLGYLPAESHYMADELCGALGHATSSKKVEDVLKDIDNFIAVLTQAKKDLVS